MKGGIFFTVLLAALALLSAPAYSASLPVPSRLCLAAGQQAARQAGIPEDLMSAISLVETGRALGGEMVPWPWTINAAGKGYWFPSKAAAISFVEELRSQGINSIDVGCFQINLRWHPGAFSSLREAFDPASNARYAAQFITALKRPGGGWLAAAGAYHSGNEEFAARYRMRVNQVLGEDALKPDAGRAASVSPPLRRAGGIELAWYANARGTGLLTPARGAIFTPPADPGQP